MSNAADLIRILDQCVNGEASPLRESVPALNAPPDDVTDISPHLKFVNREEQVDLMMEHMKNLYQVIDKLDQYEKGLLPERPYAEPKKHIVFTTAVGTAGKGKTTFARRAVESRKCSGSPGFEATVNECLIAGRKYRIACDDMREPEFSEYAEVSFGRRLLYEALKYRLRDR